jgi:hypothetical protein
MEEPSYLPVGQLGGAEVGVQPTLDGQAILIQHGDLGQRLACRLAFGKADIIRRGDRIYWRIAHDKQVDGLLVELIDLLISIRYAHPALVQLELALPVPSGTEGSDGARMILEPAEP